MKQGTYGNINALATEIARRAAARQDFIVRANHIEIISHKNGSTLLADAPDGGNIGGDMTPLALQQLGTHLGVPKTYVDRMAVHAPALLEKNFNTWLEKDDTNRMVRLRDNKVDAFLSDKYKRMDNAPIASVVLPTLAASGVEVQSCDVTDTRMFIKVVSPRLQGDVKVNDPVQMGLMIRNSEVGLGALDVTPLIYRLICENGMVSARSIGGGIRRTHRGAAQGLGVVFTAETLNAEARSIGLQVRDTVNQLLLPETFEKHLEALRETTLREIKGKVPEAVLQLGKAVGFTQSEGDDILKHLINGGDLSQWGMINAVTAYAQTVESYDRSTELEQIGGKIIELKPRVLNAILEAA